jgi:hypothetical protein
MAAFCFACAANKNVSMARETLTRTLIEEGDSTTLHGFFATMPAPFLANFQTLI